MDEPCAALDPIATLKIEELIQQLKKEFTIVIVTHNMQQATRCSDFTAFMYSANSSNTGYSSKSSRTRRKSRPKNTYPVSSASWCQGAPPSFAAESREERKRRILGWSESRPASGGQ
ncbi:MAG: hypothetical protein R3F11_21665 [Verrucomicrobiales bacterium]